VDQNVTVAAQLRLPVKHEDIDHARALTAPHAALADGLREPLRTDPAEHVGAGRAGLPGSAAAARINAAHAGGDAQRRGLDLMHGLPELRDISTVLHN
jgi:hypothetical protein